MTRVAHRRPRVLGPEPAAQLRRAAGRRGRVGLRPAARGAREGPACAIPPCRRPPTTDIVLDDDDRRRRGHRHADLDPLRPRQGGAQAGKHVFVEKPMTTSATEREELVELADAAGLTLMVGHTFVYSPPVRKVERPDRRAASSATSTSSPPRASTSACTRRTSAWSGTSPRTTCRSSPTGSAKRPTSVNVTGRACVSPDIPDVAFVNLRFPSGVVANIDVSWLSPVKLRRTVVVGVAQDAALRRHRERREGQDLRPRRRLQGARDVRRVPALVPHRRHHRAASSTRSSRCTPRRDTSSSASQTGRAPDHRRHRRPPGGRVARGRRALAAQRRRPVLIEQSASPAA